MSNEIELKQMDKKQKALMQTVRETVFPGATDPELALFFNRCAVVGCNPLDQLIFPMKFKDKQAEGGFKVVFITSINLLRSKSNETGLYDGMDEPEFSDNLIEQKYIEKVWKDNFSEEVEKVALVPEWCKVLIYRKDIGRPFVGKCYWTEYYPGDKKGGQWILRPRVMLAKVAEAQARRLAFPEKLNKLYTDEELMISSAEMAGVEAPGPKSTKPTVNPESIKPTAKPIQAQEESSGNSFVGTVQAAEEKKGPKNVFYVITIDGKGYSSFSKTHFDVAVTLKNKKCDYLFEQNGKYLNLKAIRAHKIQQETAQGSIQNPNPTQPSSNAPEASDASLFVSNVYELCDFGDLNREKIAGSIKGKFGFDLENTPVNMQADVLQFVREYEA